MSTGKKSTQRSASKKAVKEQVPKKEKKSAVWIPLS